MKPLEKKELEFSFSCTIQSLFNEFEKMSFADMEVRIRKVAEIPECVNSQDIMLYFSEEECGYNDYITYACITWSRYETNKEFEKRKIAREKYIESKGIA